MSKLDLDNLGALSMLELFQLEVESQSSILTRGLLGLEREVDTKKHLAELMRAAHSLKGAARIVGRKQAVRIAHALEECFVGAQKEKLALTAQLVDVLLEGVDLLNTIARVPEETFDSWEASQRKAIEAFLTSLAMFSDPAHQVDTVAPAALDTAVIEHVNRGTPVAKALPTEPLQTEKPALDRTLRITADNLNRMMGLAGEALAAGRWIDSFSKDLLRVKQFQQQLGKTVEAIQELQAPRGIERHGNGPCSDLLEQISACHRLLADRLADLEQFDRRFMNFSTRLYHEVLDCRMRPFAEGVQGFQRMVRDVARQLGKKVKLDIQGEATLVDRDILERLKAPLDHLLRNAIDHGIETPAERQHRGKPEEGTLELSARHSAGMLLITLTDDGRGIDPEKVRAAVVRKNLTTLDATQKMDAAELLDFLFLPGFTLKESVSEISGRGIGLDAVQAMAKEVGGVVRVSSQFHSRTKFQLELPLTLSVVRTLLVEIAGEPFALPLSRIDRALKVSRSKIAVVQGRQHFAMDDHQVGLAAGHQVLGLRNTSAASEEASVIVFGNKTDFYGLMVDRFLGERELVVRPLDPRLGKVKNVSSAALMPDGSPVFILDVDDLKRSIENIASDNRHLEFVDEQTGQGPEARQKRVLVVDDSLTVRELERKLLVSKGYAVDVAIDGMHGWNAVRTGGYDLMITDIDMPRLDGIELLRLVRRDSRLKSLPVMVVSYKDREEDRNRGLEAGADYYLTKASFHDDNLLRVVADLIGAANG